MPALLDDVRVLDASGGIAGPYATKVLADAGADVVTLEPAGGDPLRRRGSGALFEFLHTSKRSVHGTVADLVAGADILVTDEPVAPETLWAEHRSLVVVTVTPFGSSGPWVGRPWTEFTLQAACGSTGQRGLPDQPPLAAGGRIGEWVAGSYAAVGALAALREARRSGLGEHVDVAILDAMAVTMIPFPSVFSEFLGWPPMTGTGRQIEVPSIEPTRDGYVVFTTNSAQQFAEFLGLIDRTDLAEDRGLFRVNQRFERRDEFLEIVRAFTTQHTTAEILEAAAERRVPAGPVLRGSTVTTLEHFTERGVFVDGPSGRFVQPRVPYAISGTEPRPFAPAPEAGADTVDWPARRATTGAGTWQLPLRGLRVVDCTAWWAGPAATHVLACLGADVIKVESAARPDHMRFTTVRPPTEDGWWEWCPVFHGVNGNKRGLTVDLNQAEGIELFERLLGTADVLAENYTPRVMDKFGFDWERVHERHTSLVMVRMPAFGLDGPWRDRTGFAQTMECLTGMAWLTGWADGPPVLVRGACDPIAGLHSVVATLLGLTARDRSGEGVLVEAAMVEAALNAAAEQVVEFGATGDELVRDGNRGPDAAPQGVYPCSGTDRWIAIAVADDAQWSALCGTLGLAATTDDELDTAEGRRGHHDELDARIAEVTSARDADDVVADLVAAGVPAAVVISARDIAHNEQLLARGLFETEHHPVTGDHPIPVLPFRFSRVAGWLRAAAPTLGQDNDQLLDELGLDERAVEALRKAGVIGERPAGS